MWRVVGLLVLVGCSGPIDLAPADAGPPDAPPDGGPPAALEPFLDYQMSVGGIRGLAVAITTPDATVLAITRGEQSEGVPVDAHTLFTLASISKTFVGVLVMQLVEDGLLDLDAPVDDVLPYAVRHPAHPDLAVTARMLLTHTSGMTDDFPALSETTYTDRDPDVSLRTFSMGYVAAATHWDHEPGTTYAYCNACYGVLGDVIEAASGEDLRARSEARLFAPLALDGAGWWLADLDPAHLATPYAWNVRSRAYTPLSQYEYAWYPAGALRVSLEGMTRWARFVARDGELDGARALSEATVTEMRRVPFPDVARDRAHGWDWDTRRGRRFLGHSGETFGGSTRLLIGEDGVALILLTNSDAYVRAEVGSREGVDALNAILDRLDDEADALAR